MLSRFERFSLGVHEIYRFIHKLETEEMKKYGLRGSYVRFLVAMMQFPEGLTVSQLCEVCDQDKAAVSRAVSELVGREIIWRDNPKGNHYRARLKLTEKGVNIAREVCGSAQAAVDRVDLSEEQREQLYGLMSIVTENLHKMAQKGIEKYEI